MFEKRTWFHWQVIFAGIWVLLTTSLTTWWMMFAFSIVEKADSASESHRTMLLYEGATLFALLFIGGFFLVFFILREKKRNIELQNFFSAFTHDLKTILAGVRIQAESLRQDLQGSDHLRLMDRLQSDISRLNVKLENSLYVGRDRQTEIFVETISLSEQIELWREAWPKLKIHLAGDARVRADGRIFEMVIHNIIHNAISHGDAQNIWLNVHTKDKGLLEIDFVDDGKGFSGETDKLGKLFYRHNPSSGTGLGLYTSRAYMERMGGSILYMPEKTKKGFLVRLYIPGETL